MNCNKREDELISYVLDTLGQEDKETIEIHFTSCRQCQRRLEKLRKARSLLKECEPSIPLYNSKQFRQKILADLRAQQLIEETISKKSLSAIIANKKKKVASNILKISQDVIGRMVSNRSIIGAVMTVLVVISIVLGVNFINKSIAPDVAWGELVEKIESIDFYTFKSQIYIMDIHEPFFTKKTTKYYISKDGFRRDCHYPFMVYDIITYTSWSDKTNTIVLPGIKKYTRTLLTDERINRLDFLDDPRLFIKLLMSFNYTKLGNKIIDGKEAQGIEINIPKFGKMGFESCLVRIWVGIDTNLPIFLEIEATSGHGMVETKIVIDTFEWNGEYDSSLFEPNLSGYSLMAEVESMPMNEESTIKALRRFSQVADGKYPSRLSQTHNLIHNLYYKLSKERMGKGFPFWEEEGFDWEGYISLHSHLITAGMFYGKLFNNDKEVAYYGEKVAADDLDLPLMRWKIADDKYRVIFGDLRIEDVSSEQLAELESALNK